MHLVPDPAVLGPFQRAARLRRAARPRRRQDRRRLCRQLQARPAVGVRRCSTCSTRAPACRSAIIDATVITDMRTGAVTAIGAKHLARQRRAGPRPCRRARHGLLERAPARPTCSISTRSASIRAGRKAATRSRHARRAISASRSRRPTTGESASRAPTSSSRHRASSKPEPLLKTAWIKTRRAGRPLRHDERGRAVAHRHHGQDRRRRLGPVQVRQVRRAARPCRERPS